MIFENKNLMVLVDYAKKINKIEKRELLNFFEENSNEYEEFISYLESENIEVVETTDFNDFINNIEKDEEFNEFSQSIETELKTKDIDDLFVNSPKLQADDSVKMMLREISAIPLLNSSRELQLARDIQEGLSAQSLLDKINKHEKKATPLEIEKLNEIVEDGLASKEVLITSNIRLVVSIAKKFIGRGIPLADLISEGCMGLMKSCDKFDPTKGFKFSTYATWWIKQSITRCIADQARCIRIPVHKGEHINAMLKTQRRLTMELQRDPTIEEIALAMNIPAKKVEQLMKDSFETISIDKSRSDDDDSSMLEYISDTQSLTPSEYTKKEKLKEEIEELLNKLNQKERKVIRLRYGFEDGRVHTLDEIGIEFNLTRERIRQIEYKALKKLTQFSKTSNLTF